MLMQNKFFPTILVRQLSITNRETDNIHIHITN